MNTTIANVTDEQIDALRYEAILAGDKVQAALCNAAIHGSHAARQVCAAAIQAAAAMIDD